MADTGNPWFIPFAEPSDLVRDWPALSSAVGTAVAAGLSAAIGLVAVKSAIFKGTQTNSTAGGANFAVTDLTITHAVADASNKLIISAFLGAAATSGGTNAVGLAVHDGTSLIAIGDVASDRTRVTAGGPTTETIFDKIVTMPSVTFVHTPNTTDSQTYTVRAINVDPDTRTLYINRRESDGTNKFNPRAVSSLVIQEVKV
jgi:hypothetical protein